MKGYKLLGARHFINEPSGTIFVLLWETEEECMKIIEKYKNNDMSFINWNELHIWGDNSGSMSFYGAKEEDYIFYYDMNVVGDASPYQTLYLVIDESVLPEKFETKNEYGEINVITKSDVLKARDKFIKYGFDKQNNDWAIEKLETDYKDDYICNINM